VVAVAAAASAGAVRPRRGLFPYSVRTIHSALPYSVPHPVFVPRYRPVPVKVVEHVAVAVPRAVPVRVPRPVAVEVPRAVEVPVPRAVPVEVANHVPVAVPRAVPLHFPHHSAPQFAHKSHSFAGADITEAFAPTALGGFKAL